MTTKYEYTYATDFPDGLDAHLFSDEIKKSTITEHFTINPRGEKVYVIFDNALSTGDKSLLDSLVVAHTPCYKPRLYNKVTETLNKAVGTSTYMKIGAFIFPGGNVLNVKSISCMEAGPTSYSIRLFNFTDNETLIEKTFTNIGTSIQDLGFVETVPQGETLIEIHAKLTGGQSFNKAHIESIIIEYV